MIATAALLTSCIKLLLIPAYRSTDFEVHRNWLALTHSLPIGRWYFEDTSQWTLDYPPLFAWFEYLLSQLAILFDPNMLDVERINYESPAAVVFQRLSVIFADLFYIYGIYRCSRVLPKSWRTEVVLPVLLVTNCGLIMLDHIHFQYNGMLYGILLLSFSYIIEDRCNMAAFWFCILINMKHIYVYLGPAYFIYLLRHYCMRGKLETNTFVSAKFLKRLSSLASIVIMVFFLTYFPFFDHLGQVFSRMFPFKRGLCHAYWAPNFWAVYNVIDKVAYITGQNLNLVRNAGSRTASMTGGLVQEYSHAVLPTITPLITIVLTVISMLPALVKLWKADKKPITFLRCITLCALSSFLFGWHVHEKAIMMAIIPLSVAAVIESFDARIFLILSTVGHFSLFPLLFPTSVLLVKVLLLVLHSTYCFHSLSKIYTNSRCQFSLPLINLTETVYLLGLIFVFIYENFIHDLLGVNKKLPFLSLLFTSLYCSIGVLYCWFMYYKYFFKCVNNVNASTEKIKKK